MKKPRLIYYNDAHHFHAKRIDPPLTLHKLHWPVDEVVGTGVEALVLGLGYGEVYFHNSKIGRVVGEKKEVWENFIDWRIMRMVEDATKMGTDQVREVIKRGRKMGMPVFPSLKLNDAAQPGQERCGWLKWKHGADVCLREPDERLVSTEWCHDFTDERVTADKLAMIREMLEDYEADGIELDFMFRPRYFRKAEVEQNIPVMNQFVAQIRGMANEIGEKRGHEIPIMARVFHSRAENLAVGLDVEAWLKEKSVDFVVGQVGAQLFETNVVGTGWMADAANAAGAAAYLRPPRIVYDERTIFPHIEMFRALGQTLHWQGFAGMYLGYLPWPFSQTEYQILREVAYPEVVERHDKRYILEPREADATFTPPPDRQLPIQLEQGETASINILVADDLESAKGDGEMREPVLTIRFSNFCIEDEIEIRFNGQILPWADAEITDERAMRILARFRQPLEAPEGFGAHWFRYKLDVELLKQGENTLEVETRQLTKTAGFARCVNGVEIQTRFKDFVRPEGLNVERIAPSG